MPPNNSTIADRSVGRTVRAIHDFLAERGCHVGIVANNDERAMRYDDKLVGVPFACL